MRNCEGYAFFQRVCIMQKARGWKECAISAGAISADAKAKHADQFAKDMIFVLHHFASKKCGAVRHVRAKKRRNAYRWMRCDTEACIWVIAKDRCCCVSRASCEGKACLKSEFLLTANELLIQLMLFERKVCGSSIGMSRKVERSNAKVGMWKRSMKIKWEIAMLSFEESV